MWLLVLLLVSCASIVNCACFFGKGPRFSRKGGPAIEQITINFEGVNEKIQMEFEQIVSALEFKLQPKVFVEYSSTPRACLGLLGLV